jgi:hypothetical protein
MIGMVVIFSSREWKIARDPVAAESDNSKETMGYVKQ